MLLMGGVNSVLTVLVLIVSVIIVARVLLLAGRLVRAVEKIADKFDKKT